MLNVDLTNLYLFIHPEFASPTLDPLGNEEEWSIKHGLHQSQHDLLLENSDSYYSFISLTWK